jgi:phospholipase/carboxylesterase
MNRLATQPLSFTEPADQTDESLSLPLDPLQSFGHLSVKHGPRPSCRPAAFCPLHYERGYAYPLIVWLHGQGSSEDELRQVISRISLRNYVAVAPRGTEPHAGATLSGWTWSQESEHVETADQRVFEAIDFVRGQLNVSPKRIFLAGRGVGGTMALRIAFAHPDRFAGAISLDGLLPRSGQPLHRINELREMPLLVSARTNRSTCSENGLCRDLRLLHAAGMSLSLRYYPEGDSVLPLMLADIDRWIMDTICPSACSS